LFERQYKRSAVLILNLRLLIEVPCVSKFEKPK
jgi:hypothetical protein